MLPSVFVYLLFSTIKPFSEILNDFPSKNDFMINQTLSTNENVRLVFELICFNTPVKIMLLISAEELSFLCINPPAGNFVAKYCDQT